MGSTFRSLEHGQSLSEGSKTTLVDALPDSWRSGYSSTGRQLREALSEAVAAEILPRLLVARGVRHAAAAGAALAGCQDVVNVEAFVDLVVADDMDQLRHVVDRVITSGGGRDVLLANLLAPAARRLGAMWEQDTCDFLTVTLGVFRLDQIMKETEMAGAVRLERAWPGRHILMIPAPGEQHNFGMNMVADMFRAGGWSVRTDSAVAGEEIIQLVAGEWFDVVGISVMSDRALVGLGDYVAALRRASYNPKLCILAGGRAVMAQAGAADSLRADLTAETPEEALDKLDIFLEAAVTDRLHQYMTELVDIG